MIRAGVLLCAVLAFAGCGGDRGLEEGSQTGVRAAGTGGSSNETDANARGYALDSPRELPADVAQQVEYVEGGDPCSAERLAVFWLTDKVSEPDDGIHELGKYLAICGTQPDGKVEVKSPRGTTQHEEFPVVLDLYRPEDVGEYEITAVFDDEPMTRHLRIVPAKSPIVRPLLRLDAEPRAGEPVRIIGTGYAPGAPAGFVVYECGTPTPDDPFPKPQFLTVVPLSADQRGGFVYDLLTHARDAGRCLVIRGHGARNARHQHYLSQFRLVASGTG